jgi:hypothetical protein
VGGVWADAGNPVVMAKPTDRANDKPIDRAVDRKAVARADWVTAFLCGESSRAPQLPSLLLEQVYLLEYVEKILMARERLRVCAMTAAKSRPRAGCCPPFTGGSFAEPPYPV